MKTIKLTKEHVNAIIKKMVWLDRRYSKYVVLRGCDEFQTINNHVAEIHCDGYQDRIDEILVKDLVGHELHVMEDGLIELDVEWRNRIGWIEVQSGIVGRVVFDDQILWKWENDGMPSDGQIIREAVKIKAQEQAQ